MQRLVDPPWRTTSPLVTPRGRAGTGHRLTEGDTGSGHYRATHHRHRVHIERRDLVRVTSDITPHIRYRHPSVVSICKKYLIVITRLWENQGIIAYQKSPTSKRWPSETLTLDAGKEWPIFLSFQRQLVKIQILRAVAILGYNYGNWKGQHEREEDRQTKPFEIREKASERQSASHPWRREHPCEKLKCYLLEFR